MLSRTVKTTLFCGPKELSKSFMLEAAIYWAKEGQRVVYITPARLERRPAVCHDRSNPAVADLKLMRFIYLSDYKSLVEQLSKLHTYAAVPSVLLIDDLDYYLDDDTDGSDACERIAKTCSLLQHSMNSCSRALRINMHVCVWTSTTCTNKHPWTIYFRNIWNLTEEESGKVILLERSSVGPSSSSQSYKYLRFVDGMRILRQVCDSVDLCHPTL